MRANAFGDCRRATINPTFLLPSERRHRRGARAMRSPLARPTRIYIVICDRPACTHAHPAQNLCAGAHSTAGINRYIGRARTQTSSYIVRSSNGEHVTRARSTKYLLDIYISTTSSRPTALSSSVYQTYIHSRVRRIIASSSYHHPTTPEPSSSCGSQVSRARSV